MAAFRDSDVLFDLDLEVDFQAVAATKAAKSPEPSKDLDKILPKLAKRKNIQASLSPHSGKSSAVEFSTPQSGLARHTSPIPSTPYTPMPSTPGAPTGSPSDTNATARRRNTRKSIRGSLVFKLDNELPPVAAQMRNRDIEPDEDSAASRALHKAAAMAQANANEDSPQKDSEYIYEQKRAVEGREIQQDHEQYALTYGMMLGIRVTTGRREYNLDRFSNVSSSKVNSMFDEHELSEHDYRHVIELNFLPEGSGAPPYPTPSHKLPFTFTFKDYMTNVFRAVRALGNIDEADYMMSLAGDFNYIEFIANSKSGQFFFYSHDGKYMIKTQTKEECRLLKSIMPQYVKHLSEYPDSLLVKFYGLHRVKMQSLRSKTYFVIMSSVFDTTLPIHVKYDLKGSTIGRKTELEHCLQGAVQKDLNLQESGRKISLGAENIDILHETIKADTTFLRDLNIMDYSLLVGIYEGNRQEVAFSPATHYPAASQQHEAASPGASASASGSRRRSSCGVVLSTRYQSSPVAPGLFKPADEASSPYRQDGSSSAVSIFQSCFGGIQSSAEVNEIYFMGIIDVLQLYNNQKKMETFLRGFSHDRKQVSCVDPTWYAERMLRFVMANSDYPAVMQARKAQAKAIASSQGSRSVFSKAKSAPSPTASAAPAPAGAKAKASGSAKAKDSSVPAKGKNGSTRTKGGAFDML